MAERDEPAWQSVDGTVKQIAEIFIASVIAMGAKKCSDRGFYLAYNAEEYYSIVSVVYEITDLFKY